MEAAIALVALLVALFALHASWHATRAAIFDKRLEVYDKVAAFVGAWGRDGRPNLDNLRDVVRAWELSHFLFEPSVTDYIRALWIDALDADLSKRIAAGQANGDRQRAIQKSHDLLSKYVLEDNLKEIFLTGGMKVEGSHPWIRKFVPATKPQARPRT